MSSPRRYANIGHNHVVADISDLDLSLYAALADNETVTGAWTFEGAGERILLKGDAVGASAQVNIGFDDSAGTRQGYIGLGSAINQDLYVYADTGNIRLRPGSSGSVLMENADILKMKESGGTEREALQITASDVLQVGDTTYVNNIQGSTISFTAANHLQVNSGKALRLLDSGGTDYGQFSHDGTNFKFTAVNTGYFDLQDTSGLLLKDGAPCYVYDSGNTRNSYFRDMDTTGDSTGKAAIVRSEGGALTMQSATIADDATATFIVDAYGIHWLFNTYNSTAFAHFGKTSTQAPVDYGSGVNVSMGATNPDVDTTINIWPSAATEISVKNRIGSSRTFYLLSFTRDEET